jgi:hypothetical protein
VNLGLAVLAGAVGLVLAVSMIVRGYAAISRAGRLRAEWGRRRYVERDIARIATYHESRSAPGEMVVDPRTWSDLTMDSVFAVVDRTESAIGRQVLYDRLHRLAPDDRDDFESAVTAFGENEDERRKAQLALARVADPDAYDVWRLALLEAIQVPPGYAAFPFLGGLAVAAVLVAPLFPLSLVMLVFVMATGIWVRAATQDRLAAIRPAFRQLGPLLSAAESLGSLRDPGLTPLAAEIRRIYQALRPLHRVANWVSRDPAAQTDIANMIYEYANLAFVIDPNALYFGSRHLAARRADLARVIDLVGTVDAAISIASWRAGTEGWSRPKIAARGAAMRLADARHPLVDDAVANSVEMLPPTGLIITGSNMSGKSTFLRTVGVTALLAQSVNTVVATEYESPLVAIRSCIGRSDDITTGTSYYLAEVQAVLSLLRASESPRSHLFLFDELFRGTNTVERLAAAEAVLATMLRDRHVVLAATHDGELVEMLAPAYRPCHFAERITADGLQFDYTLHAGPATTRNALALLELEGAPATLVARARETAEQIDRNARSTALPALPRGS